ncbi:hypothetical protein HN682_04240 [Candidatus Peregrinibacteria bacterium]|jgi:hypothetical protein|nr:hypothetical protein [Candidatus Peregrinibacteria bacterium]
MAEVTQDRLLTEINKKQDTMLDLKQGFYSPGEGENGDTGICSNAGAYFFGIKIRDRWNYTDLSSSNPLDVEAVAANHITENITKYLTDNSTTINQVIDDTTIINIINTSKPRTFSFPFASTTFDYVGSGTTKYAGQATLLMPGGMDIDRVYALFNNDVTNGQSIASVNPVPFKCRLKQLKLSSEFSGSGSDDMDDARFNIGVAYTDQNQENPININTGNLSPSYAIPWGYKRVWDYTYTSTDSISSDGFWYASTTITNPTNYKFKSINGLLIFEEVL